MPRGPDAVAQLAAVGRRFGPEAARRKARLIEALPEARRMRPRAAASLRATLEFLRAWPDNARVLRLARERLAALPPPEPPRHPLSLPTIRRLAAALPGALEIDWSAPPDQAALHDLLALCVSPCEELALDDIYSSFEDWLAESRPRDCATDVDHLLRLLDGSGMEPHVQAAMLDRCELTLTYRGPSVHEIEIASERLHAQRRDFDRSPFPLEPRIRQPLPRPRRGGAEELDAFMKALAARSLEIHALTWGSPEDVVVADCGHGMRLLVVGPSRDARSPLESLLVFLVLKNGVPVAYGPYGVLAGCCELGINLFPEFRGGDVRSIYAQVMRVAHHLLGADRFLLTAYGMGQGNPAAIASGAFWFYRKLGFSPTNPDVEAIARAEEARMARDPSHRSSRATLRRMSYTDVVLDLSGGRRQPVDVAGVGYAVSRFVAERFGGDRRRAERECAQRVGRLLRRRPGGWALPALSPVLCVIDGLDRWSEPDLRRLAAVIDAKDGPSEAEAARRIRGHRRLVDALLRLGARD